MPSYIVRNGQVQPRQKDFNVPNYRIIPYKSVNIPTVNDYYTNTIDQLQKQLQAIKSDYRNLIQVMWKTFSQIDRTPYDPQIMFHNLKFQEIYDKISLIRSINAYQPEQQSLKLSAIVKVDDNVNFQSPDQIKSPQQSPRLTKIRQQVKQQTLYEIQQEQQCGSNSSRVQFNANLASNPQGEQNKRNSLKNTQNSPKGSPLSNRPSLSQLSGQKRQSRRTSFLLKQKISLAFHQQQQLRQLLQEQLQKLSRQLDEKNQYLTWTIEQLKSRNQLIQKLKQTLIQRDETFQVQQRQVHLKEKSYQSNRYQELLQEKDREIGQLINSLIERTEETFQDFEFLTKSIKGLEQNIQTEQNQKSVDQSIIQKNEQTLENQSIFLDELQISVKQTLSDKVANSREISGQTNREKQNEEETNQQCVLKPVKMNFDSVQNMKLLTKQHFIQAQKKQYSNIVIDNVKMTQSIKTSVDIQNQKNYS